MRASPSRTPTTVVTPGTLCKRCRDVHGYRGEVVLRGDRVVRLPELVHCVEERAPEDLGQDRDERDQREPDHQRGGRRARPLRVSLRVLPGQLPGRAAGPGAWRPEHGANGTTRCDEKSATPKKISNAPEAHEDQHRLGGRARRPQRPKASRREAEHPRAWPSRPPGSGRSARAAMDAFAHGRDRRHPRRPESRAQARQDRDPDPTARATITVRGLSSQPTVRKREPERVEQPEEPPCEAEPQEDARRPRPGSP